MTKPAAPEGRPPQKVVDVVEIDAIDGAEWERDQHTPQAPVAGLAALVRQTAPAPARVEPRPRQAPSPAQSAQQPARRAAPQSAHAAPQPAQGPTTAAPAAAAPQKGRGRPPKPPAKTPPIGIPPSPAPAAEPSPFDTLTAPGGGASPFETVTAPAGVSLAAETAQRPRQPEITVAPEHLRPEVVRLPLSAPPSEPITVPALLIQRPVVVEPQHALRAAPDHTPAPPSSLPQPPPALESFDPPAHTGSPEQASLRPRLASRRVIALAGASAAVVIAVIAIAATRGSSSSPAREPSGHASPAVASAPPAPPAPTTAHAIAIEPPPAPAPSGPADAHAAQPASSAPPTAASAQNADAADGDDDGDDADDADDNPSVDARAGDHRATATAPASPHGHAGAPPRSSGASTKPHRPRPQAAYRGNRKASKAVAVRPAVHQEPDPPEDEPSVAHARTAYAAGNQALFAGDSAAAIRAYRQVLSYVPTYAAGFRGLGLAHAQQGDLGAAVMALRTYLSLAPGARDVALIKKRIALLQAASAERSAQRQSH